MKKLFYLLILLFIVAASACKKAPKVTPTPIPTPTPVDTLSAPTKIGSVIGLIKDSVYLYAAEDYLWYTQLPSYAAFKPRTITGADGLTALTTEVDALSQFAINPATGKPYEYYVPSPGIAKYSFIDNGSVSAQLNGVQGDFGFDFNWDAVTDVRIIYVYPGSPADLAGIKRGYKILSINNSTNISYDYPPYGDQSMNNYNFVINALTNSNTVSMTLQKPDGSTLTVTSMNTTNYTINPVLTYKTFDEGNGRIVGYIVFNSFTSDANADPQLNTAFSYFTAQGITDLVVDLRYNGGGYVSTAEYLDNLIVPTAKDGTPMYVSTWNDKLVNDNDPLLKAAFGIPAGYFKPSNQTVNFSKNAITKPINIKNVFFIITRRTASASELTINNLRPELNVQFIGSTSYGKPVGFIGININKYQYYTPEFSTQNSAGQGGYYTGFTPEDAGYPGKLGPDDITKDFGDPTEGLLSLVLTYIKTGVYSVPKPVIQSLSSKQTLSIQDQNAASLRINHNKFNGMILNNKLKQKKSF
jgi:carboxyl-terminal processing protease